jgi:hypothetical protein
MSMCAISVIQRNNHATLSWSSLCYNWQPNKVKCVTQCQYCNFYINPYSNFETEFELNYSVFIFKDSTVELLRRVSRFRYFGMYRVSYLLFIFGDRSQFGVFYGDSTISIDWLCLNIITLGEYEDDSLSGYRIVYHLSSRPTFQECVLILSSSRQLWRQYQYLKCRSIATKLHGAISQKTVILI